MPLHLPTTSTPSAPAVCWVSQRPCRPDRPTSGQAHRSCFEISAEKRENQAICGQHLPTTSDVDTNSRHLNPATTSELNSALLSLTLRQGTTAAFGSTTIHSYTHNTHDDDLACTRPASPACRAASGTAREIQGPNHRCISIAIAISFTSRDYNAQEAQGPEHLRAPPGRRVRVQPSSIRSPFQSFDEFEISIESPILSLILMFVDFFNWMCLSLLYRAEGGLCCSLPPSSFFAN